ncbi:hypothetical protein Bca52824_094830 [Brassica carinata]|uniref:Myb-like domain-containing protein n=1 Tax=Brassica carinata TaxID=52824 RepID=A0A8X7TIL5_BRACI|nr:hypothetical protein Bca52824_094830 [Brassica carinata]
MGKGRVPCCDKTKVKRGPWSYDKDLKLISLSFRSKVIRTGDLSLTKLVMFLILKPWSSLGFLKSSGSVLLCISMYACNEGLLRCGLSCPDVKRGNFSVEEEETIVKLHQSIGSKYVLSCWWLVWPQRLDSVLTIAFLHFGFRWSKIASKLPERTDNEIKKNRL